MRPPGDVQIARGLAEIIRLQVPIEGARPLVNEEHALGERTIVLLDNIHITLGRRWAGDTRDHTTGW